MSSRGQGTDALRVAVAAAGVADAADGLAVQFNIDLLRTDRVAGQEGSLADAALHGVGNQGNVKHNRTNILFFR